VRRNPEKVVFIEEAALEAQGFDRGKVSWQHEARVTHANKPSAGIVQFAPGKGTTGTTIATARRYCAFCPDAASRWWKSTAEHGSAEWSPKRCHTYPQDAFHFAVDLGGEPMEMLTTCAPPGLEVELRTSDVVHLLRPKR